MKKTIVTEALMIWQARAFRSWKRCRSWEVSAFCGRDETIQHSKGITQISTSRADVHAAGHSGTSRTDLGTGHVERRPPQIAAIQPDLACDEMGRLS